MAALSERFIAVLAELHAVDVAAAELGPGTGTRLRRAARLAVERALPSHTRNVPDFEPVMRWLEANRPPDAGHCVIHNDFRLDNVALDRADPLVVNGVLD
jgi:aminoglycoside phosphotransferase (APT) family kinase protein